MFYSFMLWLILWIYKIKTCNSYDIICSINIMNWGILNYYKVEKCFIYPELKVGVYFIMMYYLVFGQHYWSKKLCIHCFDYFVFFRYLFAYCSKPRVLVFGIFMVLFWERWVFIETKIPVWYWFLKSIFFLLQLFVN